VLVTAYDTEQLLGIPRLDKGNATAQALATYKLIEEWGVGDRIVGTVFDTTSTNTGCNTGTCLQLETMLGKSLLHCACRHHVDELVLGAVTSELLGDSKDPRLPFFAKLTSAWPTIKSGIIIVPLNT